LGKIGFGGTQLSAIKLMPGTGFATTKKNISRGYIVRGKSLSVRCIKDYPPSQFNSKM